MFYRHLYVLTLPPKELSTFITLTFPIGLPMPGSLIFLPLVFWAMISMMPTIMIITPILLHLLVYCIFSFINCSVMNFSNIRGSKYFPVSLHLHDKCRCGPVVRLPEFPLNAIFLPSTHMLAIYHVDFRQMEE